MPAAPIVRYKAARRSRSTTLVGCLILFAGAVMIVITLGLLFLPVLPNIALQLAGAEAQGETAGVFAAATPNVPLPQVQNPVTPDQVIVNLGSYGSETIDASSSNYNTVVGSDSVGNQVATVTFNEAGLLEVCRNINAICRDGTNQFRNISIDLRPGGAVIYADVTVPGLPVTQRVGVVLRLDASGSRFTLAGVDLNGMLYAIPPDMGIDLSQVERIGNEVLNQLTLQAAGSTYTLSGVSISDSDLTLVLRA